MSHQEPKTDEATIIKVERLLVEYKREVNSAPLADSTKENYIRPATAFVRWISGDFEPGSVNKRKPENSPDQFRSIAPAEEPTYQDSLPETVFDRLMEVTSNGV